MRRLAAALLLLVLLQLRVWAASGTEVPLLHADVPLMMDKASLQRGARLYVNYCMGCHSAKYVRYEKLQRDLDIPKEVLLSNLVFNPDHQTGSVMTIAMSAADGQRYFAAAPPDLSLVARSRGEDWLYTFLHSFYAAPGRPTGADNLLFKGTAMPHVLWELQGIQHPVYRTEQVFGLDGTPTEVQVLDHLELAVPGTMSAVEYSGAMLDLVSFLVYLSEPVRALRVQVGMWVMLYLLLLAAITWLLKREYWRDIH